MICVLTDREARGYKWTCEYDNISIKSFTNQQNIYKLVFAACVEKKDEALEKVLEYAKTNEIDCEVNRLFCIEGGPSLFGKEVHYSDGIITPLFAVVMGLLSMREDEAEHPKITRCVELLLEHSANPYIVCKVAENCFPIEISRFELDLRGLLRLCRMFQVGSPLAAEKLERLLDSFEMKLPGLQDL